MKQKRILVTVRKIITFPIALINTTLSLIALIIIPFLFYLPLSAYKLIILLIAKCVIPGSKILSVQDSAMAMNNFHSDRNLYVHNQWHFEGKFSFEDFLEAWDNRVMKHTLENGQLQFPELRYYIDTFMGYFFRRLDNSFDLKNHLKLYQDPNGVNSFVDKRQLDKIIQDFRRTLFPKKRSPWEALLVTNCKVDENNDSVHSVIIFKFHHCLVDGYALLVVLWEALMLQKVKPLTNPKLSHSVKNNIFKILLTQIAIVFQLIKMAAMIPFNLFFDPGALYDRNSWHKSKLTSESVHCTMSPIDTSLVKEICAKNGVNITTVLFAAIAGGFRRMMESKGLASPPSIRITHSIPLPNHPQKLTSHSAVTYCSLELFNSKSKWTDKKMLQSNERNLKMAIRAASIATRMVMFFFGSLPIAWTRIISSSYKYPFSFTSFYANIPLPPPLKTDVEFLGSRFVGCYAAVELAGNTNVCTTVCVMKYKQSFFINYGIQKHLLETKDNIYLIEKYVLEELMHLNSLPGGDEAL